MRYSMLCAVAFLAGGCALPVPVQIASWAASGISYATTGKSISDHAVSAVTEQDCALHRVALGRNFCSPAIDDGTAIVRKDPPKTEPATPDTRLRDSMIALAETLDEDIQPASDKIKTPAPLDSALLAMADTLNAIERKAPLVDSKAKGSGKHYLVIGKYRALNEAEKIRKRHAALGTKVRMVLHEGSLLYQVTAGPFSRPAAEGIEAELDRDGQKSRIALLCSDGVTPAPCEADANTQLSALPGDQLTK